MKKYAPFGLPLVVFLGLFAPGAPAQDLNALMQQNMQFDQQQNAWLQNLQQQNQMAQMQLMQNYIQYYGPQRLWAEYLQFVQYTGMQIPFEQFVYNHMATQGGRNAGPALQQQQANFRALQQANQTQQQGFDSYNQGWQQNQQRMDAAMDRYDQQAVQGNQDYVNPQTGEQVELPYSGQEGVYQNNNGTYVNSPNGQYYQVDSQGYSQELEPVDNSSSGGE
jgi:hypothetical protein